MTSPFVWKSIASTRLLPLGSVEYPQYLLGLLDRLRQQSQLARRKNNDLITCPTIPNVCLFVRVVVGSFVALASHVTHHTFYSEEHHPGLHTPLKVM